MPVPSASATTVTSKDVARHSHMCAPWGSRLALDEHPQCMAFPSLEHCCPDHLSGKLLKTFLVSRSGELPPSCGILHKWKVKVKVAQLCPTLWDPMDYTVHGILQARILEWEAFPFSRGSSQPRDWVHVSCITGRFFSSWATREAQTLVKTMVLPFFIFLSVPLASSKNRSVARWCVCPCICFLLHHTLIVIRMKALLESQVWGPHRRQMCKA